MAAGIVYCSQTGHTRAYAEWLAESLGCEATPFDRRNALDLSSLDTLVFCSWLHASSLKGAQWLKGVMAGNPHLRVAVLFSGATPMPGTDPAIADELEKAFRQTFPAADYPDLPHFYCRGGFDFSKLGFGDKIAMRLFFKMEEKSPSSPTTAQMLADMRASFDGTRREYLDPLLAFLAPTAS